MKYIFLGGAPKAGTSALYDMLAQIPSLSPSKPKETFYFIDKDYPLEKKNNFYRNGYEGFEEFFDDSQVPFRLEATTHLMYQKEMPAILAKLDSFFIFVLREPAAKLRSSFEYTANNRANIKGEMSFFDYMSIILKNPEKLKKYERTEGCLEILKRGLYNSDYPQFIKHWESHIPRERMIFIDFDFFKAHPLETVKGILGKIGLEDSLTDVKLETKNKTKGVKSKKLHRMANRVNKFIPKTISTSLKAIYFKIQNKELERSEKDIQAFETLKGKFDFNYKEFCDEGFK